MCYFIGIEDLVANALIEMAENTGKRTVSFTQLNLYGDVIMAKLKEKDTDVTLIFNREKTDQFFHDCSNIFEVKETSSDVFITLRENITTDYLRQQFRINIALHLLKAFVSQDAINVLMGIRNEKD